MSIWYVDIYLSGNYCCILIADLPEQNIYVEKPKVVNTSKHVNKKWKTRFFSKLNKLSLRIRLQTY